MPRKNSKLKSITVYFEQESDWVYEAIDEKATRDRRSLSQTIALICESYFTKTGDD